MFTLFIVWVSLYNATATTRKSSCGDDESEMLVSFSIGDAEGYEFLDISPTDGRETPDTLLVEPMDTGLTDPLDSPTAGNALSHEVPGSIRIEAAADPVPSTGEGPSTSAAEPNVRPEADYWLQWTRRFDELRTASTLRAMQEPARILGERLDRNMATAEGWERFPTLPRTITGLRDWLATGVLAFVGLVFADYAMRPRIGGGVGSGLSLGP